MTRTVRINQDRLWASLMVFMAGENGGISHVPREYSNPDACANGTDVLANAVLRLADRP